MDDKTCGTCARKISYYCDVTTWAVEDGDECSVPPEFGGDSWMPRTCGTCAHCAARHQGTAHELDGVCLVRAIGVDESYDGCRMWAERTDSVEQVALDMLNEIDLLTGFCVKGSAREAVAMMHREEFAGRLSALGVELSGLAD